MALKLTVVRSQLDIEGTRILNEESVTIGRSSKKSQWVLADPKERISRLHCQIDYRDGHYFITDFSGNGVFLNHATQRMPPRQPSPLNDGDLIALCNPPVYEIQVNSLETEGVPQWWKKEKPENWPTPPLSPSVSSSGPDADPRQGPAQPSEQWWKRPVPAGPSQPVMEKPAPITSPNPDLVQVMEIFLKGVGLPDLKIKDNDLPEVMERLGRLFHEMVRGIFELLEARNQVRAGFHIPQHTFVNAINNNPFKRLQIKTLEQCPPIERIMRLLLDAQDPAYQPPVQALQEVFNDLKAHEMAVVAGMEAALAHLLERFRPENLEARLEQGSLLDNVLPSSRKAKCWEEFQRLYEKINQEARDDFQKLFEGEFERAYEDQVRQLAKRAGVNE